VADERGSTSDALTSDPLQSPDFHYQDELSKVLASVEACEDFHTRWVAKVEKRYRAYRGLAEERQQNVPTWRSNLTIPYLLQIIEGMISTMQDPKPTWKVCPKPRPGESPDIIQGRYQSGKVASAALQGAMDDDDFFLKQRPFMQQDLIAGMTLAKVVWAYEATDMTHLVPTVFEITDDWGNVRDHYVSTEEQSRHTVLRDGPSMIVRDVRDFFWPEGSKSVDQAAYVIDRSWETWESLKEKEKAGLYKNVDLLKDARNNQAERDYSEREQVLWQQQRNKDLIEVLEYWEDDQVITVGGRQVVLAGGRPNPLRIKRKPFVACSAMPDAFQMVGMSVVEGLAQIQEYLWTLQNQRLDALRLLINPVTLIRSDVDDPDAFEWYPGAQWMVEDPGQAAQLQIDPAPAQISLQAEELLKGDLQNMLGGLPMAGGVNSGSIDQKTATGMSIITSIAQKLIQGRKQHYSWAYSHVGELFLGCMGQMLRENRIISQVGKEGAQQILVINPLDLQGDFDVKIDVMDESVVKQERIQEAMAMVNMVAPIAQIANVNLQPFIERVLEANGIDDTQRFFNHPPPPQQQGMFPPQGGQNPQGSPQGMAALQQQLAQGPPPMGSPGITNTQAATQMGGNNGMNMTPDQFAASQVQAAQQMGGGGY
jgi:hypothetical protein